MSILLLDQVCTPVGRICPPFNFSKLVHDFVSGLGERAVGIAHVLHTIHRRISDMLMQAMVM